MLGPCETAWTFNSGYRMCVVICKNSATFCINGCAYVPRTLYGSASVHQHTHTNNTHTHSPTHTTHTRAYQLTNTPTHTFPPAPRHHHGTTTPTTSMTHITARLCCRSGAMKYAVSCTYSVTSGEGAFLCVGCTRKRALRVTLVLLSLFLFLLWFLVRYNYLPCNTEPYIDK